MAEIEIGADISIRQLKRADKLVRDTAAAHGASVVASGAGFGQREWTIEVGRSHRKRRVADAIIAALRDAGMRPLD